MTDYRKPERRHYENVVLCLRKNQAEIEKSVAQALALGLDDYGDNLRGVANAYGESANAIEQLAHAMLGKGGKGGENG